jgi:excisionase family DNA binding protein
MSESTWMPDAPLLLTIPQTAALLNVCPKTIRKLISRRELVARRIGARVLVPRTSIDSFVKKDHETESDEQKQIRAQRSEGRSRRQEKSE